MVRRLASPVLLLLAISAPQILEAQLPFTVSGTILDGAQYDLYAVDLPSSSLITATLVCDFDGVSRPLDPVLSGFLPGSDPSDIINFDYYNDDGFGSDDDPAGVDCDAFDSSRIRFTTSEAVTVTFRVDGFGSSTGPYTLNIVGEPTVLAIPTLDLRGIAIFAAALLVAAGLVFRRRLAPRR